MKQQQTNIIQNIYLYARAHAGVVMGALLVVLICSTGLIAGSKKTSKEKAFSSEMKSSKSHERLEAINNLRQKREGVSRKDLVEYRRTEKNPLVRHRLNQALAEQGATDEGRELIASLQSDPDVMVRQGAAQTLGNYIQNNAVVEVLAERLEKDTDPVVRYACALSLGISKSPAAVAALEKAANSSDPDLRRQAAFSLGRINTPQAKRVLKKLSRDKDASVKDMAKGGLR